MKHERLTREAFEQTMGAWNPVGHAVLALPDDDAAGQAREALLQNGFAEQDILVFTSRELEPKLDAMLRASSGVTGFGYEGNLMRRFLALAQEGVGWLIVYAEDDGADDRLAEIAKRLGARTAIRYRTLVSEELV